MRGETGALAVSQASLNRMHKPSLLALASEVQLKCGAALAVWASKRADSTTPGSEDAGSALMENDATASHTLRRFLALASGNKQ